jgi:uncharacterized protein (UPF0210 family)
MHYQNKSLCRIRTITTFISLGKDKEKWLSSIEEAALFCVELTKEFSSNDYGVQTIRIVTNPFGEYLSIESIESAKEGLEYIKTIISRLDKSGVRIRFAIGEAKTESEIKLLPELIKDYGDLCNACVNIGLDSKGILNSALLDKSVDVVQQLSHITPRGEGNFNFTVNFNCQPLIPYFPASYHDSKIGRCFVVGLETPDLLVSALNEVNKANVDSDSEDLMEQYYQSMNSALQYHIDNIVDIINIFKQKHTQFLFSGIDTSAAPSKDCSSMTELYKLMGVEYFGAAGTVAVSALLTRVFKSVSGVELAGFSGLMLAVTEDSGLAKGTKLNQFDIGALLTNSAVCGIGLDTVPIPGDTSRQKIIQLMKDTGTMAYRLQKPLTVRLFPVPGLNAGDITEFESDDLCNCAVLAVH